MSVTVVASAQEQVPILIEGAIADRDYAAPADFAVVDVAATVADAASAGAQLPLVVRSDPGAAEAVVAAFDAAFRATRVVYLDTLEAAFGARTIGPPEIESARFRSFRSEFQAANTGFPVGLLLAQAWAAGADGESIRTRLAAALRATMTGRLIGDLRPASTVFVATLDVDDRIRTWSEASSHARAVDRSEITSLESAGQAMRQALDVLDRGAGGFMTGLLRPTVVADDYLTGLLLQERLGDKVQMRIYRRGEPIIRASANVDRGGVLAMTQLARMGLEPLAATLEPAPAVADNPTDEPATEAPGAETGNRRLLLMVGGSIAALALAIFALAWSSRRHRKLHAPATWLDQPAAPPAGGVREALLPHLARELKNRLVHALFAQRQELLHNEATATQRVADLEERLAKLQPAIAEKIRGYEQRIRALEAEIEEKDQETRDLIRAKLVLARKELDAEIRRQHITWN